MKRRHDRRACLGFQWDAGAWDDSPLWFDALFNRLQGRRVHWNLPAFPPETAARRRAAVAKPLRSRIESSGDLVTAMGYAGACHPLLNLDELEKELSWGLKNPWGTGITDVLDQRPPVLIPQVADLARPAAWKLYQQHGFSLVGVCREEGPVPAAGSCAGCLSVVRLRAVTAAPNDPLTRRIRRAIGSGADIFLLVDLTGVGPGAQLDYVLELADPLSSPGSGFTLIEVPEPGASSRSAPPWRADWSAFPAPLVHAKLHAISGMARRKRKKSEEYQGILSRLAPGGAPETQSPSDTSKSRNSMRLVAHMLGDVVLAGTAFDVRLGGGRFSGITRMGKDLVPRVPAVSYLRLSTRTVTFRTTSSFSFEGENGTGLREELALEGQEGGSMSIEYSFRDDSPHLSIAGVIRYPRLPDAARVEEHAPLVLTLREIAKGARAEIEASAPDGSESRVVMDCNEKWVVLPGAMQKIRRADGGWIVLRYQCPEGGLWGLPGFRFSRAHGRRLLSVNPFGSYAPVPATALSGRQEAFSMLLGLEDA